MKLCIQTTSDLLCIRLPSRLEAKIVLSDNRILKILLIALYLLRPLEAKNSHIRVLQDFQTFFLQERKNSILKAMAMLIINSIYLWNLSHFHRKKFRFFICFVAESRFCVLPPLIVSPPGAFYGPSNILDYTRQNEDMKRFCSYWGTKQLSKKLGPKAIWRERRRRHQRLQRRRHQPVR